MYKYKMFEFVTKWVIVLYNHITQYYLEKPKIGGYSPIPPSTDVCVQRKPEEIAKPILKRNHAEYIGGYSPNVCVQRKPDAYKSIHASEYSYPLAPAGERHCKMTGIVGI
jgi:hypothetical protein